jgi:outer membrane murein-binding lipoprotein Lpp
LELEVLLLVVGVVVVGGCELAGGSGKAERGGAGEEVEADMVWLKGMNDE